jgi:hypothetical protein
MWRFHARLMHFIRVNCGCHMDLVALCRRNASMTHIQRNMPACRCNDALELARLRVLVHGAPMGPARK